jgi:hypothetical protein
MLFFFMEANLPQISFKSYRSAASVIARRNDEAIQKKNASMSGLLRASQ